MLPRFLKGHMGEAIIASFRDLLQQLELKRSAVCKIPDFLSYFSEKAFDLDRLDLRRRGYLHTAAAHGDCGVISGLLEARISANSLDSDGLSPLVISIKEDKVHAARLLLECGVNVNLGGSHAGTALHVAVFKSEVWITRTLLKKGADPNLEDSDGNVPLHILCGVFASNKKKNALIGEMLVKAGAACGHRNRGNCTPVHIAARRGQAAALCWMLQVNEAAPGSFDLNAPGGQDSSSPLHLAALSGHFKAVITLVENGGDVYRENAEGKTPKEVAKGDLAVYKYLSKAEKDYWKRKLRSQAPVGGRSHVFSTVLDRTPPLHLSCKGLGEVLANSGEVE